MATTTDGRFGTLRDLVLYHAARRGWRTQRHIAVACGLDETALSRFLDGRQDIGAVRTYALFRELGVPIDTYPLAFELLERSQRLAREIADARRVVSEGRAAIVADAPAAAPPPAASPPAAIHARGLLFEAPPQTAAVTAADHDTPQLARRTAPVQPAPLSAVDAARFFLAEGFSGEQIAAFFAAGESE